MEAFSDYDRYDAVGLAELVAGGDVHPVELALAAIARVEATDGPVNAVVSRRFERAVDEAGRLPLDGAPFRGVPTFIKDLVLEADEPVTFGSVFFRAYRGPYTTEFAARIRRAGFVRLGRTNTPEFGLLPTTEPALHGPTRNPWDLGRSAGGSSGGAAAAVAARYVPLAQGSDGGGSIRIPASACGVFGLKPSRGRMPRRPATTSDYLSVELALSRTVRDSAAFLDAIGGATPGDQYQAPPATGPFRDAAARDPGPLRIAFSTVDFRGSAVHPECRKAILDTAELLEDLGHELVEERPAIDGDELAVSFLDVWASLAGAMFELLVDAGAEHRAVRVMRSILGDWRTAKIIAAAESRKAGRPAFEPFTWALGDRSRRRTPGMLQTSIVRLQKIAQTAADFLEHHDLFLTPVLGSPPLPIGAIDQSRSWEELTEELFAYVAFTPLANFAGLPAMSVPLSWTDGGLPVGSHFLGRYGDEATLLSLAGQLERARPWSRRIPPVAATR